MIECGKDKSIEQSSALPSVSVGVEQFLQDLRVGIVQSAQIDGMTQEIVKWRRAMACVQPVTEKLSIMKEGERSWQWFSIFSEPDLTLATDDIVVIAETSYRIMEKVNWAQHGYLEYHAIEFYKKYDG